MKNKKISVRLTKKQIKKLRPLWIKAMNKFDNGRPGMILGQPYLGIKPEFAVFSFIPFKETKKILKIHNPKQLETLNEIVKDFKERKNARSNMP